MGYVSRSFTKRFGECTEEITETSQCIMSPHYPEVYEKEQDCTFSVDVAGTLTAVGIGTTPGFLTEGFHDRISIGCNTYMGSRGPLEKSVAANTQLEWSSDFSIVKSGWKICAVGNADLFVQPADATQKGPCYITDDKCWASPNFPHNYANNQYCQVTISAATSISAPAGFLTEFHHDWLTILGGGPCHEYSGTTGPNNFHVDAGEEVHWHSDYSIQKTGWKLCVTPTALTSLAEDEETDEEALSKHPSLLSRLRNSTRVRSDLT